jgi:sortase B
VIIKSVLLFLIVALVVSSVYIIAFFQGSYENKRNINSLKEIWNNPKISKKIKFEELIKQNSDFKAWITIDNTNVDYPVYQTGDDEFYLSHNNLKEESVYGALFLSYTDSVIEAMNDRNISIYGHSMNDGSMFATVMKYKSLNFYKQNPTIRLYTVEGNYEYKIFSVMLINANPLDDKGYVFDITRDSFYYQNEFDSWINEAYSRSYFNTGVEVTTDDSILTLVTCTNEIKDGRFVVMARRVRKGEDNKVDTSVAVKNENVRYPKSWYDKKGIEYPFNNVEGTEEK